MKYSTLFEREYHICSLCSYYLEVHAYGERIATGTCFGYSSHGQEHADWLVTNWHLVTGRHPISRKALTPNVSSPTHIFVYVHQFKNDNSNEILPGFSLLKFDLYDNQTYEYAWREQPTWNPQNEFRDIVALPLEKATVIVGGVEAGTIAEVNRRTINNQDCYRTGVLAANHTENENRYPHVGEAAFVIGFPFADIAKTRPLPIWKAATIASEGDSIWTHRDPNSLALKRPSSFYIDTASRPGMSGSPVFIKTAPGEYEWVGIYSGRLVGHTQEPESLENVNDVIQYMRTSVFDAQLGIAWPGFMVDELICNNIEGNPHRKMDVPGNDRPTTR